VKWGATVLFETFSLRIELSGLACEVAVWPAIIIMSLFALFDIHLFVRRIINESIRLVRRRAIVAPALLTIISGCAVGFALIHWHCALAVRVLVPPFVLVTLGVFFLCQILQAWAPCVTIAALAVGAAVGTGAIRTDDPVNEE